ncbi:MAG: radical SAM protein [Reinekea sp.]
MKALQHKGTVILVGFQDQDNLGVRYLAAAAEKNGFRCKIVSFDQEATGLINEIIREKPILIGFSLIFQYMTPVFAQVIERVRAYDSSAHITIGGHYSSFEPETVLNYIPALDSVIRFDGEITLALLLQALSSQNDWRKLKGVAFRGSAGIVVNPLREPVEDLDSLEEPIRDDIPYEQNQLSTASILGSRGCPWNCSFCSIRPFYEDQGGKLRRLRAPEKVVDEIERIHNERGVKVFLFQDDDFLASGKRARKWSESVAENIIKRKLNKSLCFKISCRSDEIDFDNMSCLAEAGLTHVYMGVESGDEQGLININKHLKPESHMRAGDILKSLNLSFDFGFMLLEPYSTFNSIRNNIRFLEDFVGDGSTVAGFCRMLPYAGTPVAKKLKSENRLLGTEFEPDYKFLDPRLDLYYQWVLNTFYERNFSSRGLVHILKYLNFEVHLNLKGCNGVLDKSDIIQLKFFTAWCNRMACQTLAQALDYFESRTIDQLSLNNEVLMLLTEKELAVEQEILSELVCLYKG